MKLLVGLGNPGAKYAMNRHNVGFMAVELIAAGAPWANKFRGVWAETNVGGEKVYLLKPQTFMNLSGESVGEACRFFKIAAEDVVVLHDELDLPLGEARLKFGGGHAGHNGLRSIDPVITPDYYRVRIGIGRDAHKDSSAHVLSDFTNDEMMVIEPLIDSIAKNLFSKLEQMKKQKSRVMTFAGEEKEHLSLDGRGRSALSRAGEGETVEFARQLRHAATDAERKLWSLLRNAEMDGHKFRRQHPMDKYIVDFICLQKKLVIELDGGQHAERKEYDQARSEYLAKTGHRVLRFWNHDVMQNTEAVYKAIQNELEKEM